MNAAQSIQPEIEITLERVHSSDEGTVGIFSCGNVFKVFTMELPWRNNARNISCIPAGKYKVVRQQSPKHGDCYLVLDVPNRSNILFHVGNWAGDSELDLKTDSEGCTLPGTNISYLHGQLAVTSSGSAMKKLKEFAPDGFILKIADLVFRS